MKTEPKEIIDLFNAIVESEEFKTKDSDGVWVLERVAFIMFTPSIAFRVFRTVVKYHLQIWFRNLLKSK